MVFSREQLIDHLDSTRNGMGAPDMDARIAADPDTTQEWNEFRLAVDAVEQAAIYQHVLDAKDSYRAQQTASPIVPITRANTGIVHSIYRVSLRAAAVILVLGASAVVYKYSVTSANGIYSATYTPYDLNTSRGATNSQDDLESAYKAHDWSGVDDAFRKKKAKDNKSFFLEGMADMESKKYDEAIGMFQQVIAANSLSGSDYFEDEAEFYLAMSWLARNDVKEAMPLLDKIRADKKHLYHDVVEKMSTLDLRIAEYKNLK